MCVYAAGGHCRISSPPTESAVSDSAVSSFTMCVCAAGGHCSTVVTNFDTTLNRTSSRAAESAVSNFAVSSFTMCVCAAGSHCCIVSGAAKRKHSDSHAP